MRAGRQHMDPVQRPGAWGGTKWQRDPDGRPHYGRPEGSGMGT